MTERLANNAQTTLSEAINDVDDPAVFDVAVPTRFPTQGNFRVLVDSEIMLVTAVSGNQFTATRAQEGTDIATHSAGAKITHILTAGGTQQFVDDRILESVPSQTSNGGKFLYTDGSATSWQYAMPLADIPPATPGLYDEEFNGALNTLPTDWAWNPTAPSGSDAWYVNRPSLPSCLVVYGNGNGDYFLQRSNFTASGDFGIWAKIICGPAIDSVRSDFRMYLYNAAQTEGRCMEVYPPVNNPSIRALKKIGNSESAWSSGAGYPAGADRTTYYLGLTRTSGNVWTGWASANGIGYHRIGAPETHSFTLDRILFSMNTTTVKTLIGIDWIRYRSDLDFPIF